MKQSDYYINNIIYVFLSHVNHLRITRPSPSKLLSTFIIIGLAHAAIV